VGKPVIDEAASAAGKRSDPGAFTTTGKRSDRGPTPALPPTMAAE